MALLDAQKQQKPERLPPASRRVAEAFTNPNAPRPKPEDEPPIQDAVLTVSDQERLQTMDFDAMSAAEIEDAKKEIRRLALPLDLRRTRSSRPDPAGPVIDLRGAPSAPACVRAARSWPSPRSSPPSPPAAAGRAVRHFRLRWAGMRTILLHFLAHPVTNHRDQVFVFLFGDPPDQRDPPVPRARGPEVAFQMVSHAVPDWSGGTRIGEALERFNKLWARRVLGQGAIVLLITDGLDRDGAAGLADNMDRLHRSSRRLIWLNPLLRWSGFEPKSQGIRAMLPHVDEFRPVHNLASLRAIIDLLSRPAPRPSGWTQERDAA